MINYIPTPTGLLFHESDAKVKILIGSFGSGKSCCCAVDILAYACAQAPGNDGVRYSRVGIIRATYNELISTTRRSLLEVLPNDCGSITSGGLSPRGLYTIPLSDGTTVQLELNFIALQSVDDLQKVRSMNWSFAWLNEGSTLIAEILPVIQQRIGRFPTASMGGTGVSWGGVLVDSNMPQADTWLYNLMKNPPEDYCVLLQPPAAFENVDEHGNYCYEVNDEAENLENLGSREAGDPEEFATEDEYHAYLHERGKRYYRTQIESLQRLGRLDVIRCHYCLRPVPIIDGKPVYPNFSTARHVSKQELSPLPFQTIIIGSDTSGIHPAAVIMQQQHGKWCILDELYAEGEGLENFLYGMLVPLLRERYSTNNIIAAIDPSNPKDSWTAHTPKQRFEELGISTVVELTNSPKIRIQNVEHMLNLDVGGILIDPRCELTIRGFVSDYRYRRLRATGTIGAVYTPQPEKNDSSHLQDSIQYACLYINTNNVEDKQTEDVVSRLSSRRQSLGRIM